jgi:arsenate reductase
MGITIYHNPRCSKSRQTLGLLEEQGLKPQVVEYLKTPPDARTLDEILQMLGMEPRELIRRGEAEYKAAGLDRQDLSRDELIQAMVEFPKLIQRPIVVVDGKARIGRPPESVLEIV